MIHAVNIDPYPEPVHITTALLLEIQFNLILQSSWFSFKCRLFIFPHVTSACISYFAVCYCLSRHEWVKMKWSITETALILATELFRTLFKFLPSARCSRKLSSGCFKGSYNNPRGWPAVAISMQLEAQNPKSFDG